VTYIQLVTLHMIAMQPLGLFPASSHRGTAAASRFVAPPAAAASRPMLLLLRSSHPLTAAVRSSPASRTRGTALFPAARGARRCIVAAGAAAAPQGDSLLDQADWAFKQGDYAAAEELYSKVVQRAATGSDNGSQECVANLQR